MKKCHVRCCIAVCPPGSYDHVVPILIQSQLARGAIADHCSLIVIIGDSFRYHLQLPTCELALNQIGFLTYPTLSEPTCSSWKALSKPRLFSAQCSLEGPKALQNAVSSAWLGTSLGEKLLTNQSRGGFPLEKKTP